MKKLLAAALIVRVRPSRTRSRASRRSTRRRTKRPGMQNTDSAGNEQEQKEAEEDPDPSQHFNFFDFSYRGKDEYDGKFGDGVETNKQGHVLHEEEPKSPPFIFMLLNFAILMWLLIKYLLAGRPAGRARAPRRDQERARRGREAARSSEGEARRVRGAG